MRNITRPDVTLASLIGFILSRQKYGKKCRILLLFVLKAKFKEFLKFFLNNLLIKVKKKLQKNKIN